MKSIKACFNCKKKPVYVTRSDENEHFYHWSDGGEEFEHLILHQRCPYGVQIYHDTKRQAVKVWNERN